MFKKGRIDAIAGAIPVLKYLAKNQGVSSKMFGTPLVFVEIDIHLICTKIISSNEREKLKKSVMQLKKSGKIKDIVEQYFCKT